MRERGKVGFEELLYVAAGQAVVKFIHQHRNTFSNIVIVFFLGATNPHISRSSARSESGYNMPRRKDHAAGLFSFQQGDRQRVSSRLPNSHELHL
jgi:hypothetical protein